jgi:hypothetical protein
MKIFVREHLLNILAGMLLAAALITWTRVAVAQSFDQTYSAYNKVLAAVVTDGRVNYKALKNDPEALDRFLDSAASVDEAQFKAWTESQGLAFLTNLYNAATLRLIIDHYPVESIKDIGNILKGPWDQPVVRLFGKAITLNNLEHDIIRKQYDEPRIHMALVCAAKGCPVLRSDAYTPEKLNDQLDAQSRQYLSSPAGLRIDRKAGEVYFSSIFKWYGEDFTGKYTPASGFTGIKKKARAVANFCAGYLSAADSEYLAAGGYAVKYLTYDWSLNE